MNNIQTFIISGIILLSLDFVYITIFNKFFKSQIVQVQHTAFKMKIVGAIICYLILVLGLNYFILKQKRSITDAFLLGVLIYSVYETTNYSILKNWKIETVALDSLWGGILFSITTFLIYKLQKYHI